MKRSTSLAPPQLIPTSGSYPRRSGVCQGPCAATAFAARGPAAASILGDALPLPPHCAQSPVGRVRDHDGQVLLLGVNHDANTTVHLAEIEGGAPYRVPKWVAVRVDGATRIIEYGENDHCCERFRLVDEWVREDGVQLEGRVGNAAARLVRSADLVRAVIERLAKDPLQFLHPVAEPCAECGRAWESLGRGWKARS